MQDAAFVFGDARGEKISYAAFSPHMFREKIRGSKGDGYLARCSAQRNKSEPLSTANEIVESAP